MADKNIGNPLDELFTDASSQIDPTSLAAVLKPYLRINKDSKRLLFTPAGMRLTAINKIILFFLARKAMSMHGLIESEAAAPKEVKEELGKDVPAGTIDAALKRLSEKGPLKGQGGRYFIPDFSFSDVERVFSKLNGV